MGVKEVTVSFVFEESYDEEGDYTELTLSGLSSEGDLSADQLSGLGEQWAQSDYFWIEVSAAILDTISTGKPVEMGRDR